MGLGTSGRRDTQGYFDIPSATRGISRTLVTYFRHPKLKHQHVLPPKTLQTLRGLSTTLAAAAPLPKRFTSAFTTVRLLIMAAFWIRTMLSNWGLRLYCRHPGQTHYRMNAVRGFGPMGASSSAGRMSARPKLPLGNQVASPNKPGIVSSLTPNPTPDTLIPWM